MSKLIIFIVTLFTVNLLNFSVKASTCEQDITIHIKGNECNQVNDGPLLRTGKAGPQGNKGEIGPPGQKGEAAESCQCDQVDDIAAKKEYINCKCVL